jgi:hypothetical protein
LADEAASMLSQPALTAVEQVETATWHRTRPKLFCHFGKLWPNVGKEVAEISSFSPAMATDKTAHIRFCLADG